MSVNKAIIVGRLGADPDVRYTQSNTAVATLSIATSERYKDNKTGEWQEKTEWHRAVAWGRTAEVCQQYLKKGAQIYVEGPIQTRMWEDKDGKKNYTTEIKVLTMQMLDTKNTSNNAGGGGYNNAPANNNNYNNNNASNQQSAPQNSGINSQSLGNMDNMDDDLPF